MYQESPCSDVFRKRVTKPPLKQKQRQKHLTWEKEKNNWTVAQWSNVLFSDESKLHLIWKPRSQSLEEDWRGTESMLLEVQCEVSSVSDDLGCHIICWCWSNVFSEVHNQRSHLPRNLGALHVLISFMEMLISFTPARLGTYPHCQNYMLYNILYYIKLYNITKYCSFNVVL